MTSTTRRAAMLLLLTGALILLAACSNTPLITATPTKTAAATRVAAVDTPTPLPAATATPSPTVTATASPTATATPTSEPYNHPDNVNPLTGLTVSDPAVLQRRPLVVVIGNDPAARSMHYGFGQADLVYEYVMEGRSVSRFTAVFLSQDADRIGPLRSARLVNFYLTPQYGGALVATGAGDDTRWWLKNKMAAPYLDVDLDDPSNSVYSFSLGANWMTRMQSSTARLRKWLAAIKKEQAVKLRGFVFSDTAPTGGGGTSVTVPYPQPVTWTYDPGSGRYLRSIGSARHMDAQSGRQIDAANIVVQTVKHEATTWVEDVLGNTSIRIITVGEGAVTVLRDGVAITGKWKATETSQPELLDSSGKPIALKPGNTWFELVAPADQVVVK